MVYTLTYEARPKTANWARNAHHQQQAGHTKEWRQAFWALALEANIPPLGRIAVTVSHELANRRSMPDIGACFPSVKAAIDGLVDADVIDDDDPEHLPLLTFRAPHVTGRDALTLIIKRIEHT